MTSPPPRPELPEWLHLQQLANAMQKRHLREFALDTRRARHLRVEAGPITLDMSRQRIDLPVLEGLIRLAEQCDLPGAVQKLMRGDRVNLTENRPALHTALRQTTGSALLPEQQNIIGDVNNSLAMMSRIVERLQTRQWLGYSGAAISDVVNIGVGGSDHGPLMASVALREFVPAESSHLNMHFVSSIDGTQLSVLLDTLCPETTLFLISSKSFTTPDTLANANLFLKWMLESHDNRTDVLQCHFIGISANDAKMQEWGIPADNRIPFWEWVGGRYSMWSAIGLPIAIHIGMNQFRELLAGARFMDTHFHETPVTANLPALLGLTAVWNATFLGISAHAVLPYDGRLKHLPAYLSQLEMESNGKSVDNAGRSINYPTCPIVWGEVGSNAQHTFFQLLHQGTHDVSCDFIAPIHRYRGETHHPSLQDQHRLALANCLAQSRVLMLGDDCMDNSEQLPVWRHYKGNQPSSTLLLDELTPFSLGALIALYEHKVYTMAVIWNINPFDQWGVELGKVIADSMDSLLAGKSSSVVDAPTQQLLDTVTRNQ